MSLWLVTLAADRLIIRCESAAVRHRHANARGPRPDYFKGVRGGRGGYFPFVFKRGRGGSEIPPNWDQWRASICPRLTAPAAASRLFAPTRNRKSLCGPDARPVVRAFLAEMCLFLPGHYFQRRGFIIYYLSLSGHCMSDLIYRICSFAAVEFETHAV